MQDKETIRELFQNQADRRKLALAKKQIQDKEIEERLEEFNMVKEGTAPKRLRIKHIKCAI